MIYFIADTHFGHKSMIQFGRPFTDVEEMDRHLIENWNAVVGANDTVYIIGDFWYRGKRPVKWYLQQLHGHKLLIPGNHDQGWIKAQPEALPLLDELLPPLEDRQERLVLCHYPMLEWNGNYYDHLLIHGHTHNTEYLEKQGRVFAALRDMPTALNACADITHYTPATMEQLKVHNNFFYGRGDEHS